MIQKSLETGRVPDFLNIDKIIPIYKSKNKELLSNYRPTCISLLPVISKLLEKIMYIERLCSFLQKHDISPQSIWIRTKHSTTNAIQELEDDTVNGFDKSEYT